MINWDKVFAENLGLVMAGILALAALAIAAWWRSRGKGAR